MGRFGVQRTRCVSMDSDILLWSCAGEESGLTLWGRGFSRGNLALDIDILLAECCGG